MARLLLDHLRNGRSSELRKFVDSVVGTRVDQTQEANFEGEIFTFEPNGDEAACSAQGDLRHERRGLQWSERAQQGPDSVDLRNSAGAHLMLATNRFIIALAVSGLLLVGCSKKPTTKIVNSKHVKIGFIGLTCEAPIYTAYERGFFKDEGLEPELVKCNWANYKDNLAFGSYDITHHLVMYFLKPIEQGLDVRLLWRRAYGMFASADGRQQSNPQDSRLEGQTDRSARYGNVAIRFREPRFRNARG